MPITPYMNNSGGLNLSSSPLFMEDNQATGQSYNYNYLKTGAISKVLAPTMLNLIADTQLNTLGLGQHHDVTTDVRTLVRCAGTKIQTYNTSTGTRTGLTDDTAAASTNLLPGTSNQPVVTTPFNTLTGGTQLWMAGGGMSAIQGYTGTNVTSNGTPAPTGSITPVVTPTDGGVFFGAGTYFYGVQFRKLSTQALSNVSLDVSAVVAATTSSVTLPLNTITNIDTTKYDQIVIWRSAVAGVTGFTAGSIIAKLASSATTYKDIGTSLADAQNVPRSGNTILDNSVLVTGTYKNLTTYKRRLVTSLGSTLYLSDLNKPESWPLTNVITLPTGGPITGIGVIGVPSEYTTGADEYLCVWKERELWVLTGSSYLDWAILFVDKTGCVGQSVVVPFNGFVSWIGYNGIYIWDGRGRPARISRPIGGLFESDGDLDKSNLFRAVGVQYEKASQITWRVSHRTKGVNKLFIKMDTRLTSVAAAKNLQNPEIDGVFAFDYDTNTYNAMCSFRPSNFDELLIAGDNAGFVYSMYSSASPAVSFDYETKPLDMGHPELLKRFKRVLVFVEKLTTNDLTMFYWVDYRIRDEYRSKVVETLQPVKGTQPALYDVALWDQAYWDDYSPDIGVIEFNLHAYENNSEGVSLKLRFEQLEANAPVRIHGFEIEWEAMENLPKPTSQV